MGIFRFKGQFCMNSGFSNVLRNKDTTKLKSFIVAILIQMTFLVLLFSIVSAYDSTKYLVMDIGLPPLYLLGTAIGGFLFGVFMYYAAGCGAGIFYKIGEKKTGSIIAVLGFIIGVYLTEKGGLSWIREAGQGMVLYDQKPIWQLPSPILLSIVITVSSGIALFLFFRSEDQIPVGATWGWKKTGLAIGMLGIVGWLSAIY